MKLLRILMICLAFASSVVAPAAACPSCKEAIQAGGADDEVNNLPATMNQSIYLMVSVPYLAVGIVGFLIYRGVKKNEAYRNALRDAADPHGA